MKRDRIIYWITTGLISAGMLMSSFMYLTRDQELLAGFQQLGYPIYFTAILGVAKLIGSITLLAPVASRVKEWTYAGFGFTFLGAVWTHLATSTPWMSPAIFFLLLTTSYVFWVRTRASGEYSSKARTAIPA